MKRETDRNGSFPNDLRVPQSHNVVLHVFEQVQDTTETFNFNFKVSLISSVYVLSNVSSK